MYADTKRKHGYKYFLPRLINCFEQRGEKIRIFQHDKRASGFLDSIRFSSASDGGYRKDKNQQKNKMRGYYFVSHQQNLSHNHFIIYFISFPIPGRHKKARSNLNYSGLFGKYRLLYFFKICIDDIIVFFSRSLFRAGLLLCAFSPGRSARSAGGFCIHRFRQFMGSAH
ncbi:MAG: hypothetical protein BWY90_01733 [Deltaproteobacteria bacterium ADurb.BinA014]|nr:MAG: hypothetical protein BWY90_01733 [Deltaproteobacteria bacterium ADurb.BinA014]